jgi:hypothetical protein
MHNGDPTLADKTISWFSNLVDEDDDPVLWQVALDDILTEFEKESHVLVEVGRC